MATSNHNSSQNNGDHKKFDAKRRKIEPPRTAPDSERGLTHSPYFNGPLYQRMSEDLHLGSMANGEWRVASGEWRVASGEWRVESGEWRVETSDFRLQTSDCRLEA